MAERLLFCYLLSDTQCFCNFFFFFQAEDGIRDIGVTGVQTCALPIFGMISFPPAFCTVFTAASTESTPMVLVVVFTSAFFMRPPLIPGVPSAPVFTIQ